MCNLYLAWLVRSRWSLLFGRLRPTPFAQLSPFLLLGRTRRHVLSLPCSTIFSSYLLLRVPFLFFGLVISSPGPLLLLRDAAHHAGLPNTGRFANESVRQRPVRQRMKSIRQRRMSVRQRLYASHFGTQCPKYFFIWLGSG